MAVATRSNEEIKKDVMDQLHWDGRVCEAHVHVDVSEGEVQLTGTVPNYTAYLAAEEDAWDMTGVRFVRNNLVVTCPAGMTIPQDMEIKAGIENALGSHPDIDATDIDVSVENGSVALRGSVDSFWKKLRANEMALSFRGVRGMTNELAVVPTKTFADIAIANDIQKAMERNGYINNLNLIDVKVEHGNVTLKGSVSSLPALRAVRVIAENTIGVVSVRNELQIQ
jgi:osmotically-inducible protein OsmY